MNSTMTDTTLNGREIIFEIQPVGRTVRVAAMDVATATEISIQCPAGTPESVMKTNATRKLAYVLRKKGLI